MKTHPKATRDANGRYPAAACQACGGWTSYGGCSQFHDGPNGCKCRKPKKKVTWKDVDMCD